MFEVTNGIVDVIDENDVLSTSKEGEFISALVSTLANYTAVFNNRYPSWTEVDALDSGLRNAFLPVAFVTKEGKLSKRISKWVKRAYEYELTQGELSNIGSLIASFRTGNFRYDIVDKFDWNRGDFGDHSSCFWGDRSQAKDIMMDAGGRALRFFDEAGDGIGRCWVMPKGDNWVAFNAYGSSLERIIERIPLIYPGAKVKYVDLNNFGDDDGLLYINNGTGILISETEKPDTFYVDLEAGNGGSHRCEECEEYVSEDNTHYVHGRDICESCLEESYSLCEGCREYEYRGSASWIRELVRRGALYYSTERCLCEGCMGNMSECCDCNVLVNTYRHDMVEVGYDSICPRCITDNYKFCETCNEHVRKEDDCNCQEEEEEEVETEEAVAA